MSKTVDAVYENGVLRVISDVDSLPLEEGQQVRIIIEARAKSSENPLDLAAQVYAGLSREEVDEVERIALERRDFFSREA